MIPCLKEMFPLILTTGAVDGCGVETLKGARYNTLVSDAEF